MKLLIILLLFVNLILLITEISIQSPKKIFCSGKPCNVILIVVDTLGAKHLGLYGYPRQTSPFIDSFFKKNTLTFKNAYSTTTWTNPSFASIFTSQYASEIPFAQWKDKIPPDKPNLIKILRDSSIDLRLITADLDFGTSKPVDELIFEEKEIKRSEQNLQFFSASEWLQNKKSEEKPFLLTIHNWTVHSPYDPPINYRSLFTENKPNNPVDEDELKNEKNKIALGKISQKNIDRFKAAYDQEIRYLDDQLREFFNSLPQKIIDNSIIILTSDHGEAFGEHDFLEHNNIPYQELIHVPLLIRIPNHTGKVVDQPVSLLDLAPTILRNYSILPPEEFRGINLLDLFYLDSHEQRVIKSEFFGHTSEAVNSKSNETELITSNLIKNTTRSGIFKNWKVIKHRNSPPELYNLKNDFNEKNNLFNKISEISDKEKESVYLLMNNLKIRL